MKILIFGGFLGSGKTTALMQMARYIVDHSTSDKENKVMILENEIGEIGIDDTFLRGGGFQVDNLFSGCACCTVSGELVSAVVRIMKEYDPEWLIVETTGIAYPEKIRSNLHNSIHMDPRVCILVDASRWNRLLKPMNKLLIGQINGSEAVLINKIDLVDTEAVEKVAKDITEIDANTMQFRISAMEPVAGEVWKKVLGL
jgi:G3E family GTPase